MPPPRPASDDSIYFIHIHGSVTKSMSTLAGQYSQQKRPGDLDLLTLKVLSESDVTRTASVPILVFLGLCVLDLGPMYATDRRQTSTSLNAPLGRHIIIHHSFNAQELSAIFIH